MLDMLVSHVCLGDKAGLTLAFLGETWLPGIRHPKLDGPKTREAQRVAMPLNAYVDMCCCHFIAFEIIPCNAALKMATDEASTARIKTHFSCHTALPSTVT